MRVEIVEEAEGTPPAWAFPPHADYVDLRANPQAIEQIAAVRQCPPLRNFLATINGAESIFTTSGAIAKADLPAAVSAGLAYEFASQIRMVFTDTFLNLQRKQFADLCAGLKELLERETGEATRAVLRVSCCDFTAESQPGYCLEIRLVAQGSSAQQAELRWGLGLARIQQALLFRTRVLKQKIAE